VQVLTGLPDAAAVQSDVDISALAGPVAALAVDDAGTSLFLAAGAAETVSLYRVGMDGTSQYLASFRSVAALRLSANGREALLADSAAGAVYAIRDLREPGAMETIASGRDGLGTPIAVESDSAGRIFVADQAGNVTSQPRAGPALSSLAGALRRGCSGFRELRHPAHRPVRWAHVGAGCSGADARIVAVPPGAPPAATRRVTEAANETARLVALLPLASGALFGQTGYSITGNVPTNVPSASPTRPACRPTPNTCGLVVHRSLLPA